MMELSNDRERALNYLTRLREQDEVELEDLEKKSSALKRRISAFNEVIQEISQSQQAYSEEESVTEGEKAETVSRAASTQEDTVGQRVAEGLSAEDTSAVHKPRPREMSVSEAEEQVKAENYLTSNLDEGQESQTRGRRLPQKMVRPKYIGLLQEEMIRRILEEADKVLSIGEVTCLGYDCLTKDEEKRAYDSVSSALRKGVHKGLCEKDPRRGGRYARKGFFSRHSTSMTTSHPVLSSTVGFFKEEDNLLEQLKTLTPRGNGKVYSHCE